LRKTNLTKW